MYHKSRKPTELNVFAKAWNMFVDVLYHVSVLATFFLIPVTLGCLIYYAFIKVTTDLAFMYAVLLFILVESNRRMKGGTTA